jgi:CheY-like chemotaxis protein
VNLQDTRVLVVEDDPDVCLMIEDFLKNLGCRTVATAASLEEAIVKASLETMDIAILDINLAGKLTYPIATILNARKIPFLFATGYGGAGLPTDLKGVTVLTKPFDAEQLGQALRQTLERSP